MRGFMLFELMVVITIFILCSVMGFISYGAVKGASFSSDIALLRLLFHTAATRAVCLKKEQEIVLDDRHSQCLFEGQKYLLSEGSAFRLMDGVYGPPSAPKKLITNPITFINKRVIAYTQGVLQAGTLYITNGENQYALTTPVSTFSYIRAYRYDQKVWHKIL